MLGRFKSWIYSSDKVGKHHIRIAIPILIGWFSWLPRNEGKHKNKKVCSVSIIARILSFLHLSHSAKPYQRKFWEGDLTVAECWHISLPSAPAGRIISFHWKKPPYQWVKVNSDGAFSHVTQRAAAQGVLRDHDGRILKGYQSYLGNASILYAELVRIWQGLKISKQLGFNNVVVESDSKIALVLLVKGRPPWHWSLVNLVVKIKDLCEGTVIHLVHIYREGNVVADAFAKDALLTRRSVEYEPGDCPIRVRQLSYSDKRGLAYVRKLKK